MPETSYNDKLLHIFYLDMVVPIQNCHSSYCSLGKNGGHSMLIFRPFLTVTSRCIEVLDLLHFLT